MDLVQEKCVIVVDGSMEIGNIANVVSILSISLGKLRPDIVGIDTADAENNIHGGLIQVPVPVLKADTEMIKNIRMKLFSDDFSDVSCVDFTDVAQKCMTYEDYTNTMKSTSKDDLCYFGLAMAGNKKKINKLTGSLGLLR